MNLVTIRKVYLTEESEESWPEVLDASYDIAVNCWLPQHPDGDGEGVLFCHSGCAAFRQEETDICCCALPTTSTGHARVIGELVEAPKEEEEEA
jgi:hypothetical protein